MNATVTQETAPTTTPAGRLRALARAEFTLLGRNKSMLVAAVAVPLLLPFSLRGTVDSMKAADVGLDAGTVLLPAGIGFSLLFGVYSGIAGVLTARREELVLKRLRTGELRDGEILAGSALPMAGIGVLQVLALVAGSMALLGVGVPEAPQLAVLGLLLGMVMCALLAAVTSGLTKTAESVQVTTMPFVLVSMVGSGVAVPLEVFPGRVASALELLPLSPVITLVRAGWTGDLSAHDTLGAVGTGLAWVVLAWWGARRWFRWEPRR